ncbi:unnamed protein product, partial [Polarella glacialis]
MAMKSRIGLRCCGRRCTGGSSSFAKVKVPEMSLILAGALGGPFVLYLLTPLRNALVLASQDANSSALELYASVFAGGLASGWTGGLTVVLPACPQFIAMGPLFHFLKELCGYALPAVLITAAAESFISYGPQTMNAQLAYNHQQALAGSGVEVPLWNPFNPFGPGISVHIVRNVVAISGLRIFSAPCQVGLARLAAMLGLRLPQGLQKFVGDFIASIGAAIFSAPLNQLYNFVVTSPETFSEAGVQLKAGVCYLGGIYFTRSLDGAI